MSLKLLKIWNDYKILTILLFDGFCGRIARHQVHIFIQSHSKTQV